MLRSSTKTTHRFPNGGPYTPFRRLSSEASTNDCVTRADVCAEKLTKIVVYFSRSSLFCKWSFSRIVLPVPVLPHISSGIAWRTRISVRNEPCTVSAVCTTTSWNCASFGTTYGGTVLIHSFHAGPDGS